MTFFLILFLSIIAADNVNIESTKILVEKEKIQNQVNSVDLKKPIILEPKTEPQKTESIKEVVKSKPLKQEPVQETVNSEPLKQEPVPETVNSEPIKQQPVQEVLEQTPKAQEPIKKEIKSKTIKEIDNPNESGTSWLVLALYILGPILIIVLGKNLYTRIKNNSLSTKRNDYMRQEFKEKTQSDTTEQQPAQEETQSDTTEQQTVEKDENNNK